MEAGRAKERRERNGLQSKRNPRKEGEQWEGEQGRFWTNHYDF